MDPIVRVDHYSSPPTHITGRCGENAVIVLKKANYTSKPCYSKAYLSLARTVKTNVRNLKFTMEIGALGW